MSNETKEIVIVGAGGLGRDVYQYVNDCKNAGENIQVRGFLDDNPSVLEGYDLEHSILSSIADYSPGDRDFCIVAVGYPDIRKKIASALEEKGARFYTLIHPSVIVSDRTMIGEGSILCPFAFVSPDMRIGKHVLISTYASGGHDSQIGDYSVLCPYAVLNGNAKAGEGSFMGTHSTITPGKSLGDWSKLGSGAVVLKDIPNEVLAIGVPAKVKV